MPASNAEALEKHAPRPASTTEPPARHAEVSASHAVPPARHSDHSASSPQALASSADTSQRRSDTPASNADLSGKHPEAQASNADPFGDDAHPLEKRPKEKPSLLGTGRLPPRLSSRLPLSDQGSRRPVAQPTLTVSSKVPSLQYLSMASRT